MLVSFRLSCEISMAYTPGVLSQMLQHDSSAECKIKPTKLQVLFSKSTEQHLAPKNDMVYNYTSLDSY